MDKNLNYLSENEQKWLEEIWEKTQKKFEGVLGRMNGRIPYIAKNGIYDEDYGEKDIAWWTNGFWSGILWQMYHATGEEVYKINARQIEERLDISMEQYEGLYHDVGFMWMHTAVSDYRLTGEHKAYIRGQHAANLLAGRFNILGKFIRAWNEDKTGWMIIDCLMNLSLLYWASEETKDPRYKAIAMCHADTALDKLMRPDGSCNHIAVLNAVTGEVEDLPGGQGYACGSSWSRGQAWALYGFAISYAHTKEERYLDAAKRAAHYFIANVGVNDYLPLCDFRAPKEPLYYDSTAGACAICGLLEIAEHVPQLEKELYMRSALKILQAMEKSFCDWNPETDGLLGMGRVAYHEDKEPYQVSIIYGDYFFLEAVLRFMGKDFFIW